MFKFFRSEDEVLLKKALEADKGDRQKLEKLERDLLAIKPEWDRLQAQAESLAARYSATERVYSRLVFEPWWREVDRRLKSQFESLVAQRDALTATLPQAISDLKKQIHRRGSIVAGDFSSWANVTSTRVKDIVELNVVGAAELQKLGAELSTARTEVSKMADSGADLGSIVSAVQKWIDRASESNVALLNLGATIRKLGAMQAA